MSTILNLEHLTTEQVKLLNVISEEIKDAYHQLIEQLYIDSEGSIDWLVNTLLVRGCYLSPIYIDLCYIELVNRLIETAKYRKIIVHDSAQKKIIAELIDQKGLNIPVNGTNTIKRKIYLSLIPLRAFLMNIIYAIKLLSVKNLKRRNQIPRNKNIHLIDTFFINSTFANDKFEDRYYPNLLDFLDNKNGDTVYFAPSIVMDGSLNKAIRIADHSKEQFLYNFDFLNVRDYIFALFSFLRIKKINFNKYTFNGTNIGSLLNKRFYTTICKKSSFMGLLNYRLFKRLKENGIKLELIINWFENQVIDHGFNKGAHDFFKDTKLKGYLGGIVPMAYNFHLQPIKIEEQMGILPDEINVVGKGLVDGIKTFYSDLRVMSAPAFRFNSGNSHFGKINKIKNGHTFLIPLPIHLKQSLDILSIVIEFLKQKKHDQIEILVKPHPFTKINSIKNKLSHWPNEFIIVEDQYSDLINKVDLVIGNASSTCIEALSHAVPVIVIGNQNGITQNPIPGSIPKDIWKLCYTIDDFNDSVNKLCFRVTESDTNLYREIAHYICQNYFETVTKESVNKFLC